MGRGLGVTKRLGVSRYTSKGKLYYRFRLAGKPSVSLPGEPYTPEFEEAYQRALQGKLDPGALRTVDGTLGALAVAYYGSSDWREKSKNTQTTYRRFIEYIRQEYADLSVRALKPEHIVKLRDKITKRADEGEVKPPSDKIQMSGPTMANRLVSILRGMLDFAVDRGWRADNPAKDIKPISVKTDGFPPWSESEIEAFEAYWSIGSRERLIFDLLLYTAQRSGDVRAMTWQDIREGTIAVKQEKTKTSLVLPIHPRLKATLEVSSSNYRTIVANRSGEGYSAGGFGNLIREAAREAGVQGRSAHGLRKSAATRLADAGCTEVQIQAVTGHKTTKELAKYIEARNQRLLAEAAMAKI